MINNLKDFKNATKRIQTILQTFEIKTPEAFSLSNSASLNFMARILGYENYNTIKVVLDKNISKGNSMFLDINRHDGVSSENSFVMHWKENFEYMKFGLSQIVRISFEATDNEEIITLHLPSQEWFSYKFSKNGMGEYNRIKRILDEHTSK